MHIAEGFLPVAHCVAWYAASAPFVIHGARKVIEQAKEHPESRLLLAAAGAFTFVLSSIKLPSVTGSSSHPTGTGLGAVLFRPPVMAFLSTIVLIFQALLLAHGGITTLGANVFSMGIASVQLGLAFPDPVSGIAGSVAKFMGVFVISQVPLAIAEGILGVLVFRLLTDVARPELERLGVIKPSMSEAVAR